MTLLPKKLNKILAITMVSFVSLQSVYANNFVSDAVITTKVKSKTAMDKSISAKHVNIETDHGIVKLDGMVESDTQASTLVELAQATPGVRDVNTKDLYVKTSKTPISDTYITAKVKGSYVQQNLFGGAPHINPRTIHVETNNSVVYLSGTVQSRSVANKAITIARSINGVKEVKYRLNLRPVKSV